MSPPPLAPAKEDWDNLAELRSLMAQGRLTSQGLQTSLQSNGKSMEVLHDYLLVNTVQGAKGTEISKQVCSLFS